MNKKQYLRALSRQLSGLPRADRAEMLAFYAEMIDDRMEAGDTEEAALAALAAPEDVAAQICSEKGVRRISYAPGQLILLIVGSPLWGSLLVALVAAVLSILVAGYAAFWSLVVAVCALLLALAGGGVFGLYNAGSLLGRGSPAQAAMLFGAACVAIGMALLLYPLSKLCVKMAAKLTAQLIQKIIALARKGGGFIYEKLEKKN